MGLINDNVVINKQGKEILIRRAIIDDASEILLITRSTIEEGEFMALNLEEFTITEEKEKEWIQTNSEAPNNLVIIAEYEGKVVGWLSFQTSTRFKLSHHGELGMSILKEYRNKGIGFALLNTLLNWAVENPTITKVCLAVFASNDRAIHLYKKLGFIEEGRRHSHIRISEDEFMDDILMYKMVRS